MTNEQGEQIIAFVPNFVRLLHEGGFSREQAAEAVHSSLACLFATVWEVPITVTLSEEEQAFLLSVQVLALRLFYGKEAAS